MPRASADVEAGAGKADLAVGSPAMDVGVTMSGYYNWGVCSWKRSHRRPQDGLQEAVSAEKRGL